MARLARVVAVGVPHHVSQRGERTGRPLGSADFVSDLERRLGRVLARRRPGPKPKHDVVKG